MVETRARVFDFHVETGRDWTAPGERGGGTRQRDAAWTPEHLALAELSRCTLTRPATLRAPLDSAERDCFVGASPTTGPDYTWTIDGEEL